jgi:chromosome partitioning protein
MGVSGDTAGRLRAEGGRVLVVDADPQASALDWADQRLREGLPRLFGVLGLARETLHKELPDLARDTDHLIIDGPPRVAGIARSVLVFFVVRHFFRRSRKARSEPV